MTDWVVWYRHQLQASADGFVWAAQQINPVYHYDLPPAPDYLGTWSPARHIWHVTEYERLLVLPSMRQWLGAALPIDPDWPDDDPAWQMAQTTSIESFLGSFRATRAEQIHMLDELIAVDWTTPRETLWGHRPLAMIVTKTFQHTYEHGDTLLRMGLWWQDYLDEAAATRT